MSDRPDTAVETAGKTAGKIIETIASPVLITLILICAGMVGAVMYLWDQQSKRNQVAFINLVEECVPNNRDKE